MKRREKKTTRHSTSPAKQQINLWLQTRFVVVNRMGYDLWFFFLPICLSLIFIANMVNGDIFIHSCFIHEY